VVEMSYVICEYDKVRKVFPEFKAVVEDLKNALIAKARSDWGMEFGGMAPAAGQFSWSTLQPSLFRGMAAGALTTWRQNFTSTGHNLVLAGSGTGYRLLEDYKVGIVGIAVLDKVLRFTEVKMQVSDKKLPRINIEEAFGYDKPAIVFEEGFILDEEKAFELYAYVITQGYQTLKPIGFQLNRVPDKMLGDTGSALS
jgi:hypothetical protein